MALIGDKRKRRSSTVGGQTSETYERKLAELERTEAHVMANGTEEQRQELRRKRRALKNRASAMRSREKKRQRLTLLEEQVRMLSQRIVDLERENAQLREHSNSIAKPSIQRLEPETEALKSLDLLDFGQSFALHESAVLHNFRSIGITAH